MRCGFAKSRAILDAVIFTSAPGAERYLACRIAKGSGWDNPNHVVNVAKSEGSWPGPE